MAEFLPFYICVVLVVRRDNFETMNANFSLKNFHPPFFYPGSSRSGSSSTRAQGPAGGPTGSVRQSGPGSQTDGAPGQRTQLQQQAQTSAARPGQPGASVTTGPQQQPPAQGQGVGMGQGQTKPGQMGPAGGPIGQARQTGPAGTMSATMVKKNTYLFSTIKMQFSGI